MTQTKKKGRAGLIGIIAFIIAMLLGAAALLWHGTQAEPEIIHDAEPPSQEEISDMDPQPTDGRFIASDVGLDAPMGDISIPASNVINPPDFDRVFVFRDYGDVHDSDSGTVYAATHSLKGYDSPGNSLIDIDSGAPTLTGGETISVDDVEYEVEESKQMSKTELPADEDIWDDEIDDRLVLITCLQRPVGASVENVVTIAHKID